MEVFNDSILEYLNDNNTTIDELLEKYDKMEEREKQPSGEYISEMNNMSKREQYEQIRFEQQIELLINMKKFMPNNEIYLNTECLNKAIKMYHKINQMKEAITE